MSSFLTDVQRAALDAALAEKQAAANKQPKGSHHAPTSGPHAGDKKPKNLKGSGASKKGGGGGKFTWGSLLEGEDGVTALDRNDPNYDSDEERAAVLLQASGAAQGRLQAEVAAYKRGVAAIVEEFFSSGDVGNVAASLGDLAAPASAMGHYFVKRLLTLAMDRRDKEREMASALLSGLYGEGLSAEQLQKGFANTVDALADLTLDVPDAVELLALFIARAVVDDVLPPSAAARWTAGAPEGSPLAQLRARCEQHLAARHSAERLLRCWGAGAGQSHAETKERVGRVLQEYLASLDAAEASRCLRGLGVPFFHHELVKQAVHAAMDTPAQLPHALALLARLSESGEVSEAQLAKGFERVARNLADTALDSPDAPGQFDGVLDGAAGVGLLGAEEVAALRTLAAGGGGGAPPTPTHAAAAANGAAANGGGAAANNGIGGVSVPAFKAAMAAALREYFDAADAQEVAARLLELNQPGLHPLFVKQAVALAMDRRDREREMASNLLGELHPSVITDDQMASGFSRLLAAADDLVLDIPDAVHLLSLFLGRAVVDEVLPPAFLAAALPALPDGGLGVAVVQATGAVLSQRHAAERLQGCWRGGALSLEGARKEMRAALEEFMAGGAPGEVAAVLKDLALPHYSHELVRAAVGLLFENPAKAPSLAGLLRQLSETGAVSSTQVAEGLRRARADLADEQLDAPTAPAALDRLLAQAAAEGWLPAELAAA